MTQFSTENFVREFPTQSDLVTVKLLDSTGGKIKYELELGELFKEFLKYLEDNLFPFLSGYILNLNYGNRFPDGDITITLNHGLLPNGMVQYYVTAVNLSDGRLMNLDGFRSIYDKDSWQLVVNKFTRGLISRIIV